MTSQTSGPAVVELKTRKTGREEEKGGSHLVAEAGSGVMAALLIT